MRINKEHIKLLRQYCEGCNVFYPEKYSIYEICSVMLLYEYIDKYINLEEFINCVKNCPCVTCIVKVTCGDNLCKQWIEYIDNNVREKSIDYKKNNMDKKTL